MSTAGTELAAEWIAGGCLPEASSGADEAIYRVALLDFGYEVAYLLRVTTCRDDVANPSTVAYLAVYQYGYPTAVLSGAAETITVEWLPPERFDHTFFDFDHTFYQHEAVRWWVTWVYETFRGTAEAPSEHFRGRL